MIFEIDSLKTVRYRWILFIIISQYFWNGTRLLHQVTLVLINSFLNYLHPSKTFTETAEPAIILNGSLSYVQYRLHLYSNVSHNHILLAQLQHSTRPLNKAHVFHIRSDFSICFSFFSFMCISVVRIFFGTTKGGAVVMLLSLYSMGLYLSFLI